jgi:actin-related protein
MASRCVVIDNGSSSLKFGRSGTDFPQVVFPTITGHHRHSADPGVVAVADEANDKRAELLIKYPISKGVITDWDSMELLWKHALDKIEVDPIETKILLTEPHVCTPKARETMLEIWFEKFKAKAVASCSQPLLAMFSTGSKTGIVVDMGEEQTQVVSVISGTPIPSPPAYKNFSIAGKDITENLSRLLAFRGFPIAARSPVGLEIVRDIKEQLAYVAFDPREEDAWSSTAEKKYQLPDGAQISIAEERYLCTEPLFRPNMLGRECPSLPAAIHDTVKASPIDLRKELLANIQLCGGASLLPGLPDRIEKEVISLAPARVLVQVQHEANAAFRAWLGGAVLGRLEARNVWVHHLDYQEQGREIAAFTPNNPYA